MNDEPYVVWKIECDALGLCKYVSGISHACMVGCLIDAGFRRLLKADVPFQDEPLVFEDKHGRIWDAMPERFPHASDIAAGFVEFANNVGVKR